MGIIVGLMVFGLGCLAGVCVTMAALLTVGEYRRHLAATGLPLSSEAPPEPQLEPRPTMPASSAGVPVFMIPVTLDEKRLVEVGFTQAFQEEAARIARLN